MNAEFHGHVHVALIAKNDCGRLMIGSFHLCGCYLSMGCNSEVVETVLADVMSDVEFIRTHKKLCQRQGLPKV